MNITFTFEGKEYAADLFQVQGAGDTSVYHLMIDDYYRGRLRLSAFDNRWVFDGEFADLAEGFGEFVQLLYWIKLELKEDEEAIFYDLIGNSEGLVLPGYQLFFDQLLCLRVTADPFLMVL